MIVTEDVKSSWSRALHFGTLQLALSHNNATLCCSVARLAQPLSGSSDPQAQMIEGCSHLVRSGSPVGWTVLPDRPALFSLSYLFQRWDPTGRIFRVLHVIYYKYFYLFENQSSVSGLTDTLHKSIVNRESAPECEVWLQSIGALRSVTVPTNQRNRGFGCVTGRFCSLDLISLWGAA